MDFKYLKTVDTMISNDDENMMVSFIVKVKQENYIPEGLKVRTKIDGFIFTAQCMAKDLNLLDNDPLIDNISIATKLQSY